MATIPIRNFVLLTTPRRPAPGADPKAVGRGNFHTFNSGRSFRKVMQLASNASRTLTPEPIDWIVWPSGSFR